VKSSRSQSKIKSSNSSNDSMLLNSSIGTPPLPKFRSLTCVRIDSQIVFNKLSKSTLRSIVDLRLKEVQERLDDRQISLNVDQVAKTWLTEHGYSPSYGARPLNRLIQNAILEPMAMELISGTIRANEEVKIRVEDEKLVVKRNHAPTVDPTDLTPPDMESESLSI
jgi:ATP-dependent Clp protease ATP-binding subunit ClpA